jgi:hypothetical protein
MNIKSLAFAAAGVAALIAGTPIVSADDSVPNDSVYGYTHFYGIPRLGEETVAGSGCGGDGSLGDTIADGYWRGYVREAGDGAAIEFDVVCVYRGDVNPDLVRRWREDHPGEPEPWVTDGLLVNNSVRTRTVQLAEGSFLHGTRFGADGSCRFGQGDAVPFDPGIDAWIRVVDGEARWAVSGCAGVAATVVLEPRPGSGFAFPYANFWDVPQLGIEPVLGSGCGADGSLGDSMPDGLWYGWITSSDGASLQFDVGCIYRGPLASQGCAEYPPDYGSPPCWSDGADVLFADNDSERTRTVPLAPGYVAADGVIEVVESLPNDMQRTRCAAPTEPVGHHGDNGMGEWLSIHNGQARYSLQECPHD